MWGKCTVLVCYRPQPLHFGELSKVLRRWQTTGQRSNMPVQTADLLTRYDNWLHVSPGMHPMQPTEGFKKNFVFMLTLFNFSNAWILITTFTQLFSKIFFECFNSGSFNFKINIDKSSVKCWQDLNCQQPNLAEKTLKFKPWISYFSVIIKQKTKWREKI